MFFGVSDEGDQERPERERCSVATVTDPCHPAQISYVDLCVTSILPMCRELLVLSLQSPLCQHEFVLAVQETELGT